MLVEPEDQLTTGTGKKNYLIAINITIKITSLQIMDKHYQFRF